MNSLPFPDHLKALLDEVQSATSVDVNLYFIERKKHRDGFASYELYQTQIEKAVGETFKRAFLSAFGEKLAEPHLQVVAYDPGAFDERPSLYTLPVGQIPAGRELLQRLAAHQSLAFPPTLTEAFVKRLWAYAVVIEVSESEVIYFRKYTPSKVIRDRGTVGLVFDGGHFSAIRGEVFNIDSQVDCLCINGQVYILNGPSFENVFGYREWHQQQAQATLKGLGALGTFHGLETVAQAWTQNWRMTRKLASIARSGHAGKLKYEHLAGIAKRFNLQIAFDEQHQRIDVTKSDQWELLKLLDDDYLTSPMTTDDYEVNAKRRK